MTCTVAASPAPPGPVPAAATGTAGAVSAKPRLVVIGNGMAGARTLEEILLRGGGARYDITVFGDEPYGNYNRIQLSHVLAGEEEISEIFLNPLDWYGENDIVLHAGSRVLEVDRWARTVTAADGRTVPYDTLLIATGSSAFLPPIKGLRREDGGLIQGAFAFRTIDDCSAMVAAAKDARRAVVLGGGLLGLEAARGMLAYGLEVHVVHAAPLLMNQQLDAVAGEILRASVERLGIHVLLDTMTTAVLGGGCVTGLTFADGSSLDADLLIIATGVRPNVELAVGAGLTVQRAIVTDDQMRSVDDPDIYVVGECAEHRGQVYGLVAPLWEQAKVLADHLTGRDPHAAYRGSKLVTKLKVAGVDLAVMGHKEPETREDEFVQIAEPRHGRYKTLVIRNDSLLGATLLGDLSNVAFLTQAFDRGSALPQDRLSLLFQIGGPPPTVSVAEMGDDVQICNCNGVNKGAIAQCVAGGQRSLAGVMQATRAGMGCGSCKTLVAEVVEWAAGGDVETDACANWYVPAIPLTKSDLIATVTAQELRSVSAVLAALAPEGDDPGVKPALASLLKMIWGADYQDERDARFINDRVHGNLQKDGTFSVVPRIPGGVVTSDQLRRIADTADRHKVPMIKITGAQRIDLLGVKKEELPAVWSELGMMSGFAYGKTFRTVKTCVGTDFCRYGLGASTQLGRELEERFKGLESPGKLKLAVAGCPRNCSEALAKDVGAVAIGGGRWEIYVGGACGAAVRKGDLLATVEGREQVSLLSGRFIQYYREQARWLERTHLFVARVGIERLRALLVDDVEGIAQRLDGALQRSVEAFVDPWAEAVTPATAHQFSSVITAPHNGRDEASVPHDTLDAARAPRASRNGSRQ